jgi:negative regulator of sigma-B (phosphoserine phosphatase)
VPDRPARAPGPGRAPAGPSVDWSVASRPKPGEALSGDVATACVRDGRLVMAVIDGLGHGAEAAAAASLAAAAVEEHAAEEPAALLAKVHTRLAGSRGAAATVVALDLATGRLAWLGVGNVDGVVVRSDATARPAVHGVFLAAGVLGAQLPSLRPMGPIDLRHGDTVVVATDGVRADLADVGRASLRAADLAEAILAKHGEANDDALVLVARWLDPGGGWPR